MALRVASGAYEDARVGANEVRWHGRWHGLMEPRAENAESPPRRAPVHARAGGRLRRAAEAAGLGKVGPQVLRRSFCSLAGRRGVDPVEAAQMTGHSLDVWARNYAKSFGKPQRDEARARLLNHGFGAVPTGPLAPPLAPDTSAD